MEVGDNKHCVGRTAALIFYFCCLSCLTARLAYHPGPVISQYQAEVSRRSHLFEGQSLTTAMWGMAALSVSEEE